MSLYDALKAEADARDAALWREHGARLIGDIEAIRYLAKSALHAIVEDLDDVTASGELSRIVSRADEMLASIAAAREAAGKEAGR